MIWLNFKPNFKFKLMTVPGSTQLSRGEPASGRRAPKAAQEFEMANHVFFHNHDVQWYWPSSTLFVVQKILFMNASAPNQIQYQNHSQVTTFGRHCDFHKLDHDVLLRKQA